MADFVCRLTDEKAIYMPSHSSYSAHTGFDHLVGVNKQIPIVMASESGGVVIHASDRTFAALVMTEKLWSSKFACLCVSAESIDLGASCIKHLSETFNSPSQNGIQEAIRIHLDNIKSTTLQSLIRNKSMNLKKWYKLLKEAGHPTSCLKEIDFLVLIPLMNQHPEFSEWRENGYVNHPPSFGFDHGGFCVPVAKGAKKDRRHYEFIHRNSSESQEGEG